MLTSNKKPKSLSLLVEHWHMCLILLVFITLLNIINGKIYLIMTSAYLEGDENKKRVALCAVGRNISKIVGYCN